MRTRLALVIAALLLLSAGAAFYALAYTQTGIELAAAQLSRLKDVSIHVEGVSGRLTGPLRIARIELDHKRVHLVAEDIVIDLHLRWLALQTIDVTAATAARAWVELKSAPDEPPPATPFRFVPGLLSIAVDHLDLKSITLTLQNGQVFAIDHVQATAKLNASRLTVTDFVVDSPLANLQGNVLLTAARPIGIDIDTRGIVFDGERPDLTLAATIKGNADTVQFDADLTEPAMAHASAVLTRPQGSWQVDGKVTSVAFALTPWLPSREFSLQSMALDFSASPQAIRVSGQVTVPELDRSPLALDATGSYADRTLVIAKASVTQPGSAVRIALEGQASFDGGAPTLNVVTTWQALQWPLTGKAPVVRSASGRVAVSGPLPYEFTASADLATPQLPAVIATVNGSVDSETVQIAGYNLEVLDGSVTGAGSLAFAEPKRWALSATGKGMNPQALNEALQGRIDFSATTTGSGLDPQADFRLAVPRIRGTLRGQPLTGAGSVSRSGKAWQFGETTLGLGNTKLTLSGTINESVDLRWTFNAASLASLWPDASGRVRFNGSAVGPMRLPHVRADIEAAGLKLGDWSLASLDADINVDPSGKSESAVRIDAGALRRGTLQADGLKITGRGNPTAHTLRAQIAAHATRGHGASAELEVTGSYVSEIWTGQIASGRLLDADGTQPLRLAKPAQALFSRERVEVGDLCLYLLDSNVCGSGQWHRQGPWRINATGDDVPLDILREILADQPQYLGKMHIDVVAEGSPTMPWRGDASIVLTGGAIVYRLESGDAKSTETVQLGSGRADLRADATTLSVAVGLSGAAESFIAGNATLTRLPGVDFGNSPLTGRIRGRMGDANLLPVLVAEIDHAAGALVADVTLSGRVNAPQLDGRIELNRGELDLYRLNLALRQIELQLNLSANRLQFAGNGRAGDGSWNLGGTLDWQEGLPVGTLQLKGDHLLVADLPEYRVVASPDLVFKIDPRSIRAEGEVFIPSARIQPRDLSGAVQISADSRLIQEEPTGRSSRYEVSSGIRVRLGDDVQLDTFGLQGKLGGSVNTLTRTGLIAIGRGELSVSNGKYEAYGQKLDITRGRLLFDGTPLDDPGLDIQAERTIETTKVGLNVRGTLREPRVGFYSEPTMSQTQILSYLLVGKPLDDLQSRDTAAVGSARDALALQGGGILAAQLGRRLGLEEVGVQSQGANQTALVLGKFLSPRLFVSYGISLTESINTLKLRYTITDRWILKTEAGEHQSADVEFIIERP